MPYIERLFFPFQFSFFSFPTNYFPKEEEEEKTDSHRSFGFEKLPQTAV
jgi:hypothetical protein